jgi:hypothetical protein
MLDLLGRRRNLHLGLHRLCNDLEVHQLLGLGGSGMMRLKAERGGGRKRLRLGNVKVSGHEPAVCTPKKPSIKPFPCIISWNQ